MGFAADVRGLLALVSALPLLLLGAGLLWLRPRRPENTYFAAFSIGWGLQVATANLSRLTTDARLQDFLFRTSLALFLPTALCLAYFASLHPHRTFFARSRTGAIGLTLFGLPGLFALVFAPTSVIAQTVVIDGQPQSVYGWAVVPLFFAIFYGAFYYAAWTQFRGARREEREVAGRRARIMYLALALFLSWTTTRSVLSFALPRAHEGLQPADVRWATALLFGLGFLLLAAMAALLLFRPQRRGDVDWTMVAALALPTLFAALEWLLEPYGYLVESGSLWRTAAVALIVYAIARYELFDLDLRLRRIAVAGVPAIVLVLSVAALLALLAANAGTWTLVAALSVGAATSAATWKYRDALARRLLPAGTPDADYLYHRRLEVYRARLERFMTEATGTPTGEPDLRAFRRTLGITEREHLVLEYMVRRDRSGHKPPTTGSGPVEPGAFLLGRYRVERALGEGSHGRTYLAHDEKEDRPVAIKTVGAAAMGGRAAQFLLREARLAGSLRHPNVIQVLEVAEGPGAAMIVMEYADGGSLFGLLQRKGRIGLEEATQTMDQVLAGLEAAHAKGIVHRDLKPENILLLGDGTVKLADFGVAREERPDATSVTQAGAVGTLYYMSPEQVRGRPVDGRSDLYAAAVVFHQILTGRFYLRVAGRDDFQVRNLILRGAPRLELKDVPSWVDRFLAKALEKDPERRFGSAQEMRKSLLEGARTHRSAAKVSSATPG